MLVPLLSLGCLGVLCEGDWLVVVWVVWGVRLVVFLMRVRWVWFS